MERSNGTLVAGGLLGMVADVGPEQATDIQEIVLFAQGYADVKCGNLEKFTAHKVWLKHYEDAMLYAQCTLVHGNDYKDQPNDDAVVSLETLLEEYLLRRLALPHAESIRQLFKRMAGVADTDPVALQLRQHALKVPGKGPGTSTFALQVNVLEAPTQLASLFVTFTINQPLGQHPFAQAFVGRHVVGNIDVYVSRRTWDAGKYQPIRKSIRDFLNGKQSSLILPIPCEVPDGVDQA